MNLFQDVWDVREVALFSILFLTQYPEIEGLIDVNQSFFNVTSILSGTLFVFIGLNYGDKDRCVDGFKRGFIDTNLNNDTYIIKSSIISLALTLITNIIGKFKCEIESINLFFLNINTVEFYIEIKFFIMFSLTLLSDIIIFLCFDNIINYYLKQIRNNFFIEAFKDILKDYKKD